MRNPGVKYFCGLVLVALGLIFSSCGEAVKPKIVPQADGVYLDARPSLRYDGKLILFSALYHGRKCIFTMNRRGGDLRLRLKQQQDLVYPVFSPDGSKIACVVDFSGDGRGAIALANADGTNFKMLTIAKKSGKTFDRHPIFMPGGKKIIFQRSGRHAFMQEFWLIEIKTKEEKQLSKEPVWHPAPQVISNDGRKLLFGQMVKMTFANKKKIFPYRIFELDIKNKKLQKVGLPGRNNPALSPDNKSLLYTATDDAALFISDRQGNKPRRIFYARAKCLSPLFSPDGRYAVFLHQQERWSKSAQITLLHLATGTVIALKPDWSKVIPK